jgi:flagellum-specific peptidoglycan hydrolase FlgJ
MMKTILKTGITSILFGLITLQIVIACSSCGIANKSTHESELTEKKNFGSDSVNAKLKERQLEDQKSKAESAASEKSASEGSDISIEFADESNGTNTPKKDSAGTKPAATDTGFVPAGPTGKISIEKTPNGFVIDPGGRKVKSVQLKDTKQTASKQESKSVQQDNTKLVEKTKDTTGVKKAGAEEKHVAQIDHSVFRLAPPWYAYLIVGLLIIAFIRYRLWRKKKLSAAVKNITMPYSSPNDQTAT